MSDRKTMPKSGGWGGMKQTTFASLNYTTKKRTTRRERFLSEMEAVVPWKRLEKLIEPHYPKGEKGRPPHGVGRMLRVYFMQQWFSLSDPAMEDALYDMESMRRFARFELGDDDLPDETTMVRFRHLLEEHDLTDKLFSSVGRYLEEKGLLVKKGTIVDATIIAAPSSTKNEERARDPEMHQTKKGNQWYFGMKAHVGTEMKRGLVHTVVCTPANVHDSQELDALVHGEEEELYGDSAYACRKQKQNYETRGVAWQVARKASPGQTLSDRDRAWNRKRSRVRAFGEHAFRIVKCVFGYTKTRYRGIEKNACQLFTLFALTNLYLVRKKLLKLRPTVV